MKITASRLKQIIQEEVSNFVAGDVAPPDDITGEPDEEGAMARSQLLKLNKYSAALMDMIDDNTQLPAWVQAKITKSASYLGAVKHFIEGEVELTEEGDFKPHDMYKDGDVKRAETYDDHIRLNNDGYTHER